MHAPTIEGVSAFPTSSSTDERGLSIQVPCPVWNPMRLYTAHNPKPATLRGLHYQEPGAWKVVVCLAGAVFDVIVDLRPKSKTFMQWTEIVLQPNNAIRIAPGLAHGYLTIAPDTTVAYLLAGSRSDDRGVRWDDPKINIQWPNEPQIISERDRAWSYL